MPSHEGKGEAEDAETHTGWDPEQIPVWLQDMEVGARGQICEVIGLGFTSFLAPAFQ